MMGLAQSAVLTLALLTPSVQAQGIKLADLIGHPVETDNGERLGNIEDFSIDPANGNLQFIVISIGSFLIENSLIAVEAKSLSKIANGDPLILRMEDLEVAHRFNADNWPDAADVRVAGNSASADSADNNSASNGADTTAPLSATGTATITAGSKKATYEDGKRELVNGPIRRSASAAKPVVAKRQATVQRVVPNFKNLDRNRDGRLSRAEIGAELTQRSGFRDLDIDANGTIDDFEYEAYQEGLARQRRWVGNR